MTKHFIYMNVNGKDVEVGVDDIENLYLILLEISLI